MSDFVAIDGGPPGGLPAAPSVSLSDLIIISQGGTPGVPFTATDRAATLAQLFAGTGLATTASFANDAAAAAGGVQVGQLYRNGSAVQVRVT